MNTYYINEDYSKVRCLGCQETVIYPGRYIGNYCMSCHKNQKFRKQAFKDMIEGIKSNMIELFNTLSPFFIYIMKYKL